MGLLVLIIITGFMKFLKQTSFGLTKLFGQCVKKKSFSFLSMMVRYLCDSSDSCDKKVWLSKRVNNLKLHWAVFKEKVVMKERKYVWCQKFVIIFFCCK